MSVLRGHEDLRPKAIVGFDMGFALVDCGDVVKRYRLAVGAAGNIMAAPVEDQPTTPDQIPDSSSVRARHHLTVDQA